VSPPIRFGGISIPGHDPLPTTVALLPANAAERIFDYFIVRATSRRYDPAKIVFEQPGRFQAVGVSPHPEFGDTPH